MPFRHLASRKRKESVASARPNCPEQCGAVCLGLAAANRRRPWGGRTGGSPRQAGRVGSYSVLCLRGRHQQRTSRLCAAGLPISRHAYCTARVRVRARALRGGGRRGGAPAGGAPRARPVIERVSGGSCSAARSAQSTRCASWSGRSGPSRPSANARGGAIDAVRGWCAGLRRGVKRLTSARVHASSAASEVRDVELAHAGHRRRSGAVGVAAGRPKRGSAHFCTMHSRRCGGAAGAALGETPPSLCPNVGAPTEVK